MKTIKNKILILLIITIAILTINVVYSAIVWSDDFNDKNIDDWETELLDWDAMEPFTGEAVEFDLSEETLKAPGDTPGNIWYLASHPSTVEYGIWSFDVNVVDTPEMHFYVFLMTDDWPDYPFQAYGYDLIFITQPDDLEPGSLGGVVLFKRSGYRELFRELGTWSKTEEITGWHHVKVTRDTDGVFDVYFDEELIIHAEDSDPQSGMFTSFRFEASSGPEIDNIVVLDSIEEEVTTSPIPGFPVWSIVEGLAVISILFYTRKSKLNFITINR